MLICWTLNTSHPLIYIKLGHETKIGTQYFTGHKLRRKNFKSHLSFPFCKIHMSHSNCGLLIVVSHSSTLYHPLLWLMIFLITNSLVECSNISHGGKEQWPLWNPSHLSNIAMVPSSKFPKILCFGADGCLDSSCLGTHWKTTSTKS